MSYTVRRAAHTFKYIYVELCIDAAWSKRTLDVCPQPSSEGVRPNMYIRIWCGVYVNTHRVDTFLSLIAYTRPFCLGRHARTHTPTFNLSMYYARLEA